MALPDDTTSDTPIPTFQWGAGGARMTPEQIAARRKVADALGAQASDYSPVRSWTQGLARVAQGFNAGLMNRRADDAEQANADANKQMIAALLAGGGAANAPAASSGTAAGTPVAAPIASGDSPASYRSFSPAELASPVDPHPQPSPLDAPTGADRDAMIRTVYGEAANEPTQGQLAVANVIRNRAIDGGYGGDTPSAVVHAPNQFEPWNGGPALARMQALSPGDPQYAAIGKVVDAAYGPNADDPTEGKTMFYSPSAQAALGRPAPSWAQGPGQVIGGHTFYDDNSDQPAQSATPTSPAAAPSPGVAKVASGLGAVNPAVIQALTSPYSDEGTKKVASLILQQQMTPKDVHTQETDADGNVWDVNRLTGQKTIALKSSETQPKWGVVGKDQYGQPTYGYAPTREEYAAQKAAAPPATDQPDLMNVHGKDYMDVLSKQDPKYASQVQSIIEGRAPYPTGMLLKTPYGQKLAQDVTQADPTFEAGNATARVKVRNEFEAGGVGSPAGQITAGNTALQHAGEMSDALERMKVDSGLLPSVGSADIPFVSKWANELHNSSVQGTSSGKALNDFMTAKNHFSEEVTKFYAGSAGSEAERTRALANLDAAKSLPELRSAIKTEANLMQGKINALQDRWRKGMGPLVPEYPLIDQPSQAAVDRIMQRDASSNTLAPSASNIPAPAIAKLAQNPTPEMKGHFDEVFGAGAADRILGGGK